MKIEAGKYYRTRDGRKVGPMSPIYAACGIVELWAGFIPGGELRVWKLDGSPNWRTVLGRPTADDDLTSEHKEPEKVVRWDHWTRGCDGVETVESKSQPYDDVHFTDKLIARKRIEIVEGEFDE